MTLIALGAVATALAVLWPLFLSATLWVPPLRRPSLALAPWGALPAFLLVLGGAPPMTVGWEEVLFGLRLQAAGELTRPFLLFTSCLWLVAGLYARSELADDPHRVRFTSLFLLTMAGNLGVVLAAELAGFYLFYALMTFASYGLVVHKGSEAGRRAGRVYLVMALMGEMLLLAAFLLIVGRDINLELGEVPARVAASASREFLVLLLLAGFGVKAGALLLHLWLPLAHPVAPTPASAVLSGALINAGLLGWLRFLPLGAAAMPEAGRVCALAGLAAAFYGAAIGVTQKDPKTLLAYSSISQMGFMTLGVGIALASPAAAPAAIAATVYFALHHALAKGALFLGTGVAQATGPGLAGGLVGVGLLLPALDIAGAPLSGGALAKLSLKHALENSPWGASWLPGLLSLAAVGSALLMSAFWLRTLPRQGPRSVPPPGRWVPWVLLLVVDLGVLGRAPTAGKGLAYLLRPEQLWAATWPLLAGLALTAAALALTRRWPALEIEVPPGDLLYLLERLRRSVRRATPSALKALAHPPPTPRGLLVPLQDFPARLLRLTSRAETTFATFGTIGLLFLALLFLAASSLLWPG